VPFDVAQYHYFGEAVASRAKYCGTVRDRRRQQLRKNEMALRGIPTDTPVKWLAKRCSEVR
jgi:hypothetical protein